jgi:hypothetical protein
VVPGTNLEIVSSRIRAHREKWGFEPTIRNEKTPLCHVKEFRPRSTVNGMLFPTSVIFLSLNFPHQNFLKILLEVVEVKSD